MGQTFDIVAVDPNHQHLCSGLIDQTGSSHFVNGILLHE
ncbi:hypothetical protein VII_000303 [Vibrio mimicus MB451]|nr:hypothetical protein VII_000303 [Vibrio mimicus MB451]